MLGFKLRLRVRVEDKDKDKDKEVRILTSIFTISSIFTTAFCAETSHAPSFRFEVRVEGYGLGLRFGVRDRV